MVLNGEKSTGIGSGDGQSLTIKVKSQTEFELAECDCCGLKEECTPAYIARVREKYEGRWICGLCAEAVKDETFRSEADISTDEALDRHLKFCEKFRSASPPVNPAEDLISAMKNLLRRSLDSPRKKGSVCQSPSSFARSKTFLSSISDSKFEKWSGRRRFRKRCGKNISVEEPQMKKTFLLEFNMSDVCL